MGLIISIFRYLNSESPNMEIYYSHIYFRDENRELLKCGFCPKISIYRDRVKNRALLEMLLEVDEVDTSDEEYRTVRDRVRGCNTKLNGLAQQL